MEKFLHYLYSLHAIFYTLENRINIETAIGNTNVVDNLNMYTNL